MDLVEVEPVRAQARQARLHGLHDIAARGALLAARVVHDHAAFAGEHDVLAALAENLAHQGLRAAASIHVRRVEQGDAQIQRLVDDGARGLLVDPRAKIVAADAGDGHIEAGAAEFTGLHIFLP